ncbi:hypothetical protein JZ751_001275 [Albula glossodonta]|uniref:Serotransferrin n=1 Tax=Albula glossodonta TaxID=121402 RepID=A0A8T2PT11_9TELE|nr:hypothetical protein JZ751_001275 [Albula glossodonta]
MKTEFVLLIIFIFSHNCFGKKTRWCTVSEPEQRKCAELAKALVTVLPPAAVSAFARLSCIRAYSTADCINKIRANRADAVTLNAGEVYTAVKQFGLTAVAKEIYSDGGCVLAVAVVKNSSLDVRSLQGCRSCHAGARWTAGWSLPLGFLLSRNYLPWAEEQPLTQGVSRLGKGMLHLWITLHLTVLRIWRRRTTDFSAQMAQGPISMAFGRRGRDRQRFQLFESGSYGSSDLLFRDATEKLAVLPDDKDISQVLGLDYVALLKGLGHEGSSLEDSVIRWCCISNAEQRKCEDWALSIKSDPLRDEVDAVSLDATHAFIAGKCGLVPVVAEYYGETCIPAEGGTKGAAHFESDVFPPVYAVAVVRRSSRSVLFGNMAGRRSCHGHMYSPAGWLMPARHNLSSQHNSSNNCDPSKVYSEVFWKGCLPGLQGDLCKVCIGGNVEPGTKRCADNHNERYYGNLGAIRCLVGDPSGKSYGDVAFLEHHNLDDNIQSLGPSGWAEGWLPLDFELLCLDGRRAPLSQWESCHLGAIPPNVVMTRPVLTARVYDFLMKSQETLAAHPEEFNLFESHQYGESDLLFKDATQCLVHTSHLDYRTILGEEFYRTVEAVFNCTQSDILEFCAQDVCTIF